jgi:hypothetical protein
MMGFTKYQKVENAKVVSPKGHKDIQSAVQKTGKTSMKDLSEEERKKVSREVDKS